MSSVRNIDVFRRLLATSTIAVCAIGLSGCFTSDVLIRVRADGSGIVEQTVTIRPTALLEFDKLASPELAANAQNPDDISRRFQKEYDKWAEAAHLGGNLRPRSVRPIKTAEATGWALTYEFDDVTEMRLQLVPHVPGLSGFYQVASKDPGASTTVSATLKPVNETLERFTFQFPAFAIDPSSEPPTAWASGSAQEMLQLQKLIQGSRVTIAVESTAPIVATNSPYRDQNRVTLFDIDVARALFSRQMSTLASTPATFQELLATLADLPGVTLAREHEVTIDVRNPSTQISPNGPPSSASPPDTEIYLASLLTKDGNVVVGPPVNITRSPGYDNQPSFTPDGKQILFASVRRGPATARDNPKASGAASPATDIYRYDIDDRHISRVTNTPEGEFSPAVMPDGRNISVVRVEADGTQRLWRIDASANRAESSAVLLPEVKRVGYYAWIDAATVALFILGENGKPSTLQVADTRTGGLQSIAADIGRSIQRMPSGTISFIQRSHESSIASAVTLHQVFKKPGATAFDDGQLVALPQGATDPYVVWMPDGAALVALNSTLYRWRPGEPDWTPVANLAAFGLADVTRLAVSPQGDRIAIVASAK